MAKRKTCFLVAACVWMALLAYGALNCAYADEPSDGANSWRFLNGELVLSDSGASTDNLGTFEEAAADSADSADGVMACSIETNPNGHYPVFNWFDQFSKGYCTGVGAYKGIDVSEWQGKINWAQVKTAGVDFAILRCGYASTYADTQWHNNVQGCLSTGMPFGVYLYSRATSPEEASKEADFVISQLKSEGLTGADLAFPVYFDMEDKKMVGKNYAAIAQAFFDKLTAAGYPAGTYANLSWWNTYLTSPVFDKYSKWVAAYNTSIGLTYAPMSNFSEGNGVWQFSDYGVIPGISERVDLNYTYMEPINSDHWVKSGSKWWYRYADGSYPANCWAQIDDQWYHFDASGWMQTGWLWTNEHWYYLDSWSGAMRVGWFSIEGTWYYFDANAGGAMATGLKTIQDSGYFFESSGAMATGWCSGDGVWRYATSSGSLVLGKNSINGSWYWFDTGTYAMHEGWLDQGGSRYWFADGGDGRMATGWQRVGTDWYLFDSSGAMLTGWQNRGSWYHLGPSGAMSTGWLQEGNFWYYLDTGSGAMQTGWLRIGGAWYYANASGRLETGWLGMDGVWYWFNDSCAMGRGWRQIGDSYYYFGESGAMQTGWLNVGGSRFWLGDSGIMATGWQTVDGVRHYFGESGAMAVGWCEIGDAWCWFDDSGVVATGLKRIESVYYFFDESGVMQTGWLNLNDAWHYANASGRFETGWLGLGSSWYWFNDAAEMATGWRTIGGSKYYFENSGAMVTGWKWINGSCYYFDESGVMQSSKLIDGDYVDAEGKWVRGA